MSDRASRPPRIGFLGPPGTFSEEALLSEPDLAAAEVVPLATFPEVVAAVERGETDLGFLAIENSIEGTVNTNLDALVFDRNLLIVREVVLVIQQNLLAPPGTRLEDVKRVVSFPHATAQCRRWLQAHVPGVEEVPASSTAEGVRLVGEERPAATAAIGTRLAASLYGLDVLATDIEDHDDNATRFVLVARPEHGIPPPTGHDKTSIVCFQFDDKPGSLHGILGQFSARNLNLTKLESRPTKKGLGDYCFIIDLDGHVDDEVVADCLRDLHATLPAVKFLGSYPAAGAHGPERRRDAEAAWRAADDWISDLRGRIQNPSSG
ncbi:MAG: prephenate dehydratase [Acidimicrobiaceae bacterium]|jgi:prephenate dehydratase|nr:prephenate dehydratase [Acidimicrobiaceae bacterium]